MFVYRRTRGRIEWPVGWYLSPSWVSGGPVDGACVFKRRMMEMANEEETQWWNMAQWLSKDDIFADK